MPQIYVIYRPEDTRKKSKEIIDTLQKTYGTANVTFPNFDGYVDVYDIERAVQKTDFLLVIIGNYWADLVDENGQNILASVYDPVHMAIATAINTRKRIVPILIDGASMPYRNRLPRELRPLAMQEPVKLDKSVTISKSLNKGLKDIIKNESLVKIPNFLPTKSPPTTTQSQQSATRQPQVRSSARVSTNSPRSRIGFNQARILLVLGICIIVVFLTILMVLPSSKYVSSEESVVTAVVATVAPTTASTTTQNDSTLTESPPEFVIVTPTRQRITVDNAWNLIPLDGNIVSIASTDQFIFSADESLFIFASTELEEVQVVHVETNQVLVVLDTSPNQPLVIELSPDETMLHALLNNGEVQTWGIPNQ